MKQASADTAQRLSLVFSVALLISVSSPLFGQTNIWRDSGSDIYYNSGKAGIGTTTPSGLLHVQNPSFGANDIPMIFGYQMRNVGGSSVAFDFRDDRGFAGPLTGTTFRVRSWKYGGDTNEGLANLITIDGGTEVSRFYINNISGNVGIGTTTPPYRLSVEGAIGARDLIITNTTWPDYVFRPGYRLKPLREVNAYIQQNHHLPDIPSEAEVKEKGVSVGEMQARLLAKVEELTLHLIQEQARNDRLEAQNRQMLDRITRLEVSK